MRFLITSKNGYIANHLYNWLKKIHPYFEIDKKSVRNGLSPSLKGYDVVIHTAGLVHKKEIYTTLATYMKVNRDLTVEIAKKSKESGVKHFIFLSSMAVYGVESTLNYKTIITKDTPCKPNTSYGKSKLAAENALKELETSYFKIAIVRPPMVYGKNAPGNYKKLANISKITPIFPLVDNERSMIHISNLCQLINLIITNKSTGLFFPQDIDYINTSNFVKDIYNRGYFPYLSPFLGSIIKYIEIPLVKKMFGNLVYDKELSTHFDNRYNIYKKIKNKNI